MITTIFNSPDVLSKAGRGREGELNKLWDWELFAGLVIVIMPFLMGVTLLQAYGPSKTPLTELNLYYSAIGDYYPDHGKITYVAITNLHIVICAIIFLRHWTLLRDALTTSNAWRCFIGPAIVMLLLILIIVVFLHLLEWSYFRLASNTLSELYRVPDMGSNASTMTMPVFSYFDFQLASMAPVLAAVLAAGSLVAYTSLQVRLLATSVSEEYEEQYSVSYRSIMKCLPMYSCILVTAVISSGVWFHLPSKIFGSSLEERYTEAAALQNYGNEMTLFLGVTYTLTALVAVAWPLWRLSRKAKEMGYTLETGYTWHWSSQDMLYQGNKVLGVFAPLIASFLYNGLEG